MVVFEILGGHLIIEKVGGVEGFQLKLKEHCLISLVGIQHWRDTQSGVLPINQQNHNLLTS